VLASLLVALPQARSVGIDLIGASESTCRLPMDSKMKAWQPRGVGCLWDFPYLIAAMAVLTIAPPHAAFNGRKLHAGFPRRPFVYAGLQFNARDDSLEK